MRLNRATRFVFIIVAAAALLTAGDTRAARYEPELLSEWLVAGPVAISHSALDEGMDMTPVADLLADPPLDPYEFWPARGDEIQLAPGRLVSFRDTGSELSALDARPGQVRFGVLATYVRSPAWQENTLHVRAAAPFALYLDGEQVLERANVDDGELEDETADVVLEEGHHRLLIVTALGPDDEVDPWSFDVRQQLGEGVSEARTPVNTTDPAHPFDIIDYYRRDLVSAIELSANGRWLALDLGRRDRRDDSVSDRIEVWDTRERKRVWQYRAAKGAGNLAWSPDNTRLLFKSGGELFLWHRADNRVEQVAEELENAGDFRWAPDGDGLFYKKTLEFEEDAEQPYKVMWGLRDRWSGWRDNVAFHHYALGSRVDTPLLAMKYKPEAWEVARSGDRIVIGRTLPAEERPFEIFDIVVFELDTGEARSVYQERFRRDEYARIAVSPDGEKIAFSAPVVPVSGNDNRYPEVNSSHHRLYVLDIASGEARMIDPEFKPSIDMGMYSTGWGNAFTWHEDGFVAFSAIHEREVYYCTWRPGEEKIRAANLTTPGFSRLSVATGKGAHVLAYQADDLNKLPDIHTFDPAAGEGKRLVTLNRELRELTEPAQRVEHYDYVNSDGVKIYGYLYWPRDYDPDSSYPLIVDTYGGVIGFGDSWLWMPEVEANRGYFVYVPIPRGAAGYGREYADTHVNDWGKLTSRDMNEGVEHIVANVAGVDGDRAGFVSGSYGGFLAMYLLAIPEDHPDYYPYATAISDYGISNLASYWGVGWWGVFYSEMASAGSYPWNRPDWYIEHSPLYHADKIREPLLLIHGDDDINVPVIESDQMYTALRVLDRDVWFVRFPGEGHGVAKQRAHYLESKRMHLEWFDKYLRDRPGAWNKRMEDEMKK